MHCGRHHVNGYLAVKSYLESCVTRYVGSMQSQSDTIPVQGHVDITSMQCYQSRCARTFEETNTYVRNSLMQEGSPGLFTYASSPYSPYNSSRCHYDSTCCQWAESRPCIAKSRRALRWPCFIGMDHHIAKGRSSSTANEARKEGIFAASDIVLSALFLFNKAREKIRWYIEGKANYV
uniref:G_PROTEIN_RECEP_F2_3 domain-containing protein n=1 Tax=Ascaris lumbricoides TaxID=6252 RepID=A0A0M3HRR9_ASCLU